MSRDLPELSEERFRSAIQELAPEALSQDVGARLFTHYSELRRWNRRLSLVGPGTTEVALERHYGESLAALPWLSAESPGVLLDLGSGAGFPGWVLAAARPGWAVFLVEKRERKWAFLQAATRKARLSARCLNAKVGARVPPEVEAPVDVVTLRAVRPGPEVWSAVRTMLAPSGRLLWWAGEAPDLPSGFSVAERMPLAGADRRHLWVIRLR